jgi:asparagine synthase (glutamine-hydrolysing)
MQTSLYGPTLRPFANVVDPLAEYRAALNNDAPSLIDRCLLADQRHYLPADLLMKVDAMSMAHGLEVRVPLLDRRVVGIAARLHPRLLTGWRRPDKRFLRHVVGASGAPAAVVNGHKRGFNLPVARMLRNELRPLAERVLDRDADRFEPFLVPQAVRRLWQDHIARRANHGYLLWTLMTFAVWHGQ